MIGEDGIEWFPALVARGLGSAGMQPMERTGRDFVAGPKRLLYLYSAQYSLIHNTYCVSHCPSSGREHHAFGKHHDNDMLQMAARLVRRNMSIHRIGHLSHPLAFEDSTASASICICCTLTALCTNGLHMALLSLVPGPLVAWRRDRAAQKHVGKTGGRQGYILCRLHIDCRVSQSVSQRDAARPRMKSFVI
ncbi:hypothetical protein LY76DRAFT_60163 [Colletotrichum caudatum]|nr:hypothetical protein LY76DRAFT_60163 [Colletotrichum caudatum]